VKKENVKTGQQYTAQIDGQLTMLEIVAKHPEGGWTARDLFTRKQLHVASGRYLRYVIHPKPLPHF
jgi:hypothetical protein